MDRLVMNHWSVPPNCSLGQPLCELYISLTEVLVVEDVFCVLVTTYNSC